MADAVDVLVVGAGPTGLLLAGELAVRGLKVRIVDQGDGPTTLSKAIVVHARTLEVLEDLGVTTDLIDAGMKIHGALLHSGGECIVRAGFDELESRYAYLLGVSQADTERVLEAKLATLGVTVERKTALGAFRQDGTGVTATLRRGEDTEPVRAAWLVGCDGAHSTVRKQLGLRFEGSTYEDRFLLADVTLKWDAPDDRILSFFAEDGLVAAFPMKGGRWRVIATAAPSDKSDDAPTLEQMQALFSRRSGRDVTLGDPQWLARFKIHCRQVQKYRDDRVLLAGDAAHIHSPAGGQGMNSGLQDAHNLAWKLHLVHTGAARDRLLDSYETERHAVGRAVLRGTDLATKVGTLKNKLARALRDEAAHFLSGFEFVQQRIQNELSELGVGYENSPIVKEEHGSVLEARLGTARGAEAPTVGTWRQFAAGPRAGTRAPDAPTVVAGESGTSQLFEVLGARALGVLLFDGRSATSEGDAHLAELAASLSERYGSAVRPVLITPRGARPAAWTDGLTVLLDASGELEAKYGAQSECVYVLRPDRYVGYRAQPLVDDAVKAYLDGLLRVHVALGA